MNRIFFTVTFCLIAIASAIPQSLTSIQLDSLYYSYLNSRSPELNRKGISLPHISIDVNKPAYIKCGTLLATEVKRNIKNFSPDKQKILEELLSRPQRDTSIVSPSGFFRIHYDTAGYLAPTYSMQELALALDSSFNFEVNYLGYPPPPPDLGAGGDNKYDIYIGGILSNEYGETDPENYSSNNTCTSYIYINNDFTNFYTKGIDAARVTAAHEFHHAIQYGNYIDRADKDGYFYEITSTSMEHFVFGSIHDYYNYLPAFFNSPDQPFTTHNGFREYAMCIWNFMLKDKFGYGIIKRQWELMPKMRALNAINQSLLENGSSFGQELKNFGIWCYYTNYRTIGGKYFKDAANYPLAQTISVIPFNLSIKTVQMNANANSGNYITFVNYNIFDTLTTIVTNFNTKDGIDTSTAKYSFTYTLSDHKIDNSNTLTDKYFSKFSASNISSWYVSEILNDQIVNEGSPFIVTLNYAFPSPFIYGKNQYLYFPVNPDPSGAIELDIYSSAMKLFFSSRLSIDYVNGQKVVKWNCLKNNNEKLPSGVYIYITKSGENTTQGKLVIFNE